MSAWVRSTSLGVVLIVGAVFIGSVSHPFHFDDEHSITANPNIRPPVNWVRIATDPGVFSRNPGSGMYRPVVMVSYVVNFVLGGTDSPGWHAFNLLIHLSCTVLVGLLAWHLTRDRQAQWVAALLFGLHPVVAEPVNYVSSRSESMALLFGLGCIFVYLAARDRFAWSAASVGLFAASLGCKATGMLALPVILLFEWSKGRLATSWRQWAPLAAMAALYVFVVRHLWDEALFTSPLRDQSTQLLTQVKAISYYLKLLLVPVGLTIEHAFDASSSWKEAVVVSSCGLLASALWLMTRSVGLRPWAYLLAWPLLALLPTMVVPLNVLVSEHRLYPVLAGVALLAGVASASWPWGRSRPLIIVGLALFCILSFGRNQAWASEESVWTEAARHGSIRAHVRLGVHYRQQGDLVRAEQHLRAALSRVPSHAPALNNLGNVRRQQGDTAEAQHLYEASLGILPSYPEALINLASLHVQQGDQEKALALYERATRIAPDHHEGWNNLGTLHLKRGEADAARAALEQGLRRRPESVRMLYNLSGAYEMLGQTVRALDLLRQAVGYDQSYAPAWLNLGNLLRQEGELQQARQAYERFLETYKGDPSHLERIRKQLRTMQGASVE